MAAGEQQSAGVDVGGTFTDVVIVGRDAQALRPRAIKVPTKPADQDQGVLPLAWPPTSPARLWR